MTFLGSNVPSFSFPPIILGEVCHICSMCGVIYLFTILCKLVYESAVCFMRIQEKKCEFHCHKKKIVHIRFKKKKLRGDFSQERGRFKYLELGLLKVIKRKIIKKRKEKKRRSSSRVCVIGKYKCESNLWVI